MDLIERDSSREEFFKPGTTRSPAARLPAARLADEELEQALLTLVAAESQSTADIVEHMAVFERRRLFAPKSCPSMFEYCTKVLGYSEGAAYLRIYAGRLSIAYPEILEMLRTRRLHLTAVRTVGPHLNHENREQLLSRCGLKTERELKFLIAETAPKPERAEVIRRLTPVAQARLPSPSGLPRPTDASAPVPTDAAAPVATDAAAPVTTDVAVPSANETLAPPTEIRAQDAPRDRIEPLTANRVRFAFTGSCAFLFKFERARQLLRHRHPAGALEDVFEETLDLFLDSRDPFNKKRPARPRATNPRSRGAPQWVKDVVFKRDAGRCAYRSQEGTRCEERGGLEYDHVVPWAKGGPSNDPTNIRLLCRAHNALEAERAGLPRPAATLRAKSSSSLAPHGESHPRQRREQPP